MTDAELTFLERELADGSNLFSAAVVRRLVDDSRRLRKICVDALPVVETALAVGLDVDEATRLLIVAEHATVKSLRSALS